MERKLLIADGKINFACRMDHCKANCCGPFHGINDNLSSLDGRPFSEIVLTDEDYERLYSSGRSDLIQKGTFSANNKKYYKMALNEDGSCKALVNGICSIYKERPTLCCAFPFYIDMFSGLCTIMCEGFINRPCTSISSLEPSLEAAKKMYEFWIKFYTEPEKKKEADDFESYD